MCEPALRGLRRLFPNTSISLLVKPAVAELFHSYPAIDRLVVYDSRGLHAGLSGKWALAGELRRAGFDLAVLFQNAFEAALLAYVAGIPRRYGYATDGRSLLLTEPVATPNHRSLVHQVRYYWDLLKPLGLTGEAPSPELSVSADEQRKMAERLAQSGITDSDVVIGVNPGSTYGSAKRWLPERFAEVAERLRRTKQASDSRRVAVVILGAKGEEALGREIAARLSAPCAVLSGATTIRELMAAVKRCVVLLTNDTGPMHIAAAFQVPVVAIFGPTDSHTTSPFGANHALVRQPVDCAPCLLRECPIDHRCMTRVSADQVYEAAVKVLAELDVRDQGLEPSPTQVHVSHDAPQEPLEGYTIFLDRDGTLNHNPGYLRSASELKLLPGVAVGLARLKAAGARLVVITNQSGVGRGLLTLKDLESIHARLQGLLEEKGAVLDAIYFCPHHPDDGCRCRKPGRGMVDRAVTENQLDLRRSYVIGDRVHDVQLAREIGAKAILVTTGLPDEHVREAHLLTQIKPELETNSFAGAVEWILQDAARTRQGAMASGTTGVR
jgi:heptosyltransferase-2